MIDIHAFACRKESLPEAMLHELKRCSGHGYLEGIIHIKDDVVMYNGEKCSWEMISYWDTLEKEVSTSNNQDLLSNNFIYQKCLEKTTDLLYELLHRCRGSAVLPGINDVLVQVAGLLETLEASHDGRYSV